MQNSSLVGDDVTLSVNIGGGFFQTPPISIPIGSNPSAVTPYDVDGDSDLDIVVPFRSGVVVVFDICGSGDFDRDSDVDLADFSEFAICFTGEDGQIFDPACETGDMDGDGDIDCQDWNLFRQAWTSAEPLPSFEQCIPDVPAVTSDKIVLMACLMVVAGCVIIPRSQSDDPLACVSRRSASPSNTCQ